MSVTPITQPSVQRLRIHKVAAGAATPRNDVLAVEEPLEIRVVSGGRSQRVAVTMRTPGADFELAAGFLFSEAILRRPEEVDSIRYCSDVEDSSQEYNVLSVHLRDGVAFDPARPQRNFYTTSSCGVCGKASLEALEIQGCQPLAQGAPVSSAVISGLDAKVRAAQSIFDKTGGLHAAALFGLDPASGEWQLRELFEDVGRHNAFDKLVGARFMTRGLPLAGHIVMVSGRTSFELMQKAAMAGAPIVVAVGAPSTLAVQIARQFNITLIGFARGDTFNIYAGHERISG